MRDILMLAPCRPQAQAQLEAAYRLHRHDLVDEAGREAMLDESGGRIAGIVTSGHKRIDRAMLARLPALEIVACSSAGYENIDAEALAERGIPLTNTSAALLNDVADAAIMLMLAARRNLIRGHAWVAQGNWGRQGMFPLQHGVAGRRLGLIGIGHIGQAIARRAGPMGLEVSYFARNERPGLPWSFQPDLVRLAHDSDVLIAIVAGGPATQGLVSRQVIEALGPQGTFVNVARGSVVDEAALIAALKDGRLGSAGLDVYRNEPNPDPVFASLPNVTLYPHHASGTVESRDAMAQLVVDNLAAHFAGRPLLTPVA